MGMFDWLLEEEDAQPPSYSAPPARQTPTQLAQEAYQAQQNLAPSYLTLNQNTLPGYAQLFTDIERQTAPQRQQLFTDIERQQRPQMIDIGLAGMKQADPTGFLISEEVKQKVLQNLRAGGMLTNQEAFNLDQGVQSRFLKQGRGAGAGDAYAAEKLFADVRFDRERSRIADAFNVANNNRELRAAGVQSPFLGATNVSGFAQAGANADQLFGAGQARDAGNVADSNARLAFENERFRMSKDYSTPTQASQMLGIAAGIANTVSGFYGGGGSDEWSAGMTSGQGAPAGNYGGTWSQSNPGTVVPQGATNVGGQPAYYNMYGYS